MIEYFENKFYFANYKDNYFFNIAKILALQITEEEKFVKCRGNVDI